MDITLWAFNMWIFIIEKSIVAVCWLIYGIPIKENVYIY